MTEFNPAAPFGVISDDGHVYDLPPIDSSFPRTTRDAWVADMAEQYGPEWLDRWENATTGKALPKALPSPDVSLGSAGERGEQEEPRPVLQLRKLSTMKTPPPTRWIGTGFIPRAEITVLVGDEGIGKSLAWVAVAAAVTTGTPFPPFNIPAREPADVVLIITEDGPGEVRERLKVAGADLDRVFVFSADDDGTGSPVFGHSTKEGAFQALRTYLEDESLNPALLVVDAWLDTVQGNLNIKDTQQARQALHPWKVTASRHDLSVMLLTHTNRMDTGNTRNKMGGTAALRQKARMVLYAARPPAVEGDNVQRLIIGPEKSNVTGLANAIGFDVDVVQVRERTDEDPGTTARIANPTDMGEPVRELVGKWHQETRETTGGSDPDEVARMLLRSFMQGRDAVNPNDVKAHLRENGVGKTRLERVMRELGQSKQVGAAHWEYRLTTDDQQ
ncbi:AAA family ATPase [Kocuria dechangensis]|uniref:AAA family ATPase n=1 Tax=Kocuria dechangensis TaxID=1176249 RepID=UPI00166707F4|nr:AAA family ATPase [Kocuria dechangensis]